MLWQVSYQRSLKEKSKLVNFCVVILMLKIEKICNISGILCFIILRKVKTQLKCKKGWVQCMEKEMWLIKCVKSDLWSFLLNDGPWSGRPVEADSKHMKILNENNQCCIPCGRCQHTPNIQSNKVIGENEKYLFFYGKKPNFFANPIIWVQNTTPWEWPCC